MKSKINLTASLCLTLIFSLSMSMSTAQAASGTAALRELPFDFHPGDLVEVRIRVTPPPGTTNWLIREWYPSSWDLISATNATATNDYTGELVFGTFTDDTPRTFFYAAASIQGLTNSVNFTGQAVFDEATNIIAGTTLLPSRNEWLFVGPQSLGFAGVVSGTAYGAGRWLASSFGWTTTIETGGRLTYPRALRPHEAGRSRLAYLGSRFLLFGQGPNGAQMTISDDGLAWKVARGEGEEAHADPFAQYGGYLHDVAYGNGVYIAVGYHYYAKTESHFAGAIFRSTNGYNWKRIYRLLNPSREIYAVAFGDGRFMAVGDQGTLLTSTNGSDWNQIQPVRVVGDPNIATTNSVWMSRNLQGVGHGPAGWIIPTSVAGTTLRSNDGENWTELTGTGSGGYPYWRSFYADGKYTFSVNDAGTYTTVDGAAWLSASAPRPVGPVSRAPDGVEPLYLAGGIELSSLLSSTNGESWKLEVPGGTEWPRYLAVAHLDNEWIVSSQPMVGVFYGAGRFHPNDRLRRIWTPTLQNPGLRIRDGSSKWRKGQTDVSYGDMITTPNGILAAGARPKQLWANYLVGTNYSLSAEAGTLPSLQRTVMTQTYKNETLSQLDFLNASLSKTSDGFDLYAETYSTDSFSTIHWGHFTSTNGSQWQRREGGLNDINTFPAIRGLAWGAGRFVAVSEGSSPGANEPLTTANRIFTSTDGENYVPVSLSGINPSLAGEGLTGVTFGDGRFVAVGARGRILFSTNGLDWETARDSDGRRWNRVRYLDGTWAAVGDAGWVAFSPDGQAWTSKTVGTESDLTDIAHQNGSYMVVGSHAMVLISIASAPPIILKESVRFLPGEQLQFSISGTAGKILEVQTSSNLLNWSRLTTRTNTTGLVTIDDLEPAQQARYYRVLQFP